MNFMFLKDTRWHQNPLLVHSRGTSFSKDLTCDQGTKSVSSAVNVQGKSIYYLACLLRLPGRFPASASPTDGSWSAHSLRDVTTQLTTQEMVLPLLWWEFRQLAGAGLWSLTCWPSKLIPLDFVSSSLPGDLLFRHLHLISSRNISLGQLTCPAQEVLLWEGGSWVQHNGGIRYQTLLPLLTASCPGS